MYEEKEFTFKYIIIRVLLILLFVFLLMWLLPMPNVKPLTHRIFNDNINEMSDAATSYYTAERLPKNVGEKATLTLSEMIEKKMVLPFVDEKGDFCDTSSSYVEVTKMEKEYVLKTFLACKGKSDYKIEYIGCSAECTLPCKEEKKEEVAVVETQTQAKQTVVRTTYTPVYVPTPTPTPTPTTPTPVEPKYVTYYEYTEKSYGDWSNWSKTSATNSSTLQVETESRVDGYRTEENYDTDSKTYRTVMYTTEQCLRDYVNTGNRESCLGSNERFILENIPYNASNVNVNNVTTFSSSDYSTYLSARNNGNLYLHQVNSHYNLEVSNMPSGFSNYSIPSSYFSKNGYSNGYFNGYDLGDYPYNNANARNNDYNSGYSVGINWSINSVSNARYILNNIRSYYAYYNGGNSESIYYVPIKFTVSYRTTATEEVPYYATYYRKRNILTENKWSTDPNVANKTGNTKQVRVN